MFAISIETVSRKDRPQSRVLNTSGSENTFLKIEANMSRSPGDPAETLGR